MLTMQETYTKVRTHLLAQNKQARGPMGCAYRAPDGCKCAVGCLIDDEHYDSVIEGLAVNAIAAPSRWRQHSRALTCLKAALAASNVNVEDNQVLAMLEDLQHVHDCGRPDLWLQKLDNVAFELGLVPV